MKLKEISNCSYCTFSTNTQVIFFCLLYYYIINYMNYLTIHGIVPLWDCIPLNKDENRIITCCFLLGVKYIHFCLDFHHLVLRKIYACDICK